MGDFPEGCSVLFGASGGLGIATARLMAERGTDQVLTYRSRADALDKVRAEIERMGRKVEVAKCDTRDADAVKTVLDAAQKRFGRVHGVVSATGLPYEFKQLANQSPGSFRDVIDTDVIGFFNIAQAAVALMRGSGGGSIVTLGTAGVDKTLHGNTLSSIPKSAVARMVRFLAVEEGRYNIRANMVGVGLFKAGMTLAMEAEGKLGKIAVDDFARQTLPLRRPGEAHELAELVAFLASNRASYITGQIIHVDGGMTA